MKTDEKTDTAELPLVDEQSQMLGISWTVGDMDQQVVRLSAFKSFANISMK